MPQKYQRKFLDDGVTPNPKYKPDTRKRAGDRHKDKSDRHTSPRPYRGRDTFIAIDGEGVTLENGKHVYVLLCASTGESISNPQGLTTTQCFTFLLDLSKTYPHGLFVIYGGSYDANMWLRNLGQKDLQKLYDARESATYYGCYPRLRVDGAIQEYAVAYRPRRYFGLARVAGRAWDEKKQAYELETDGHIRVWDVFSFFQKAFVITLETWFRDLLDGDVITWPDGLTIDLARMRAMKAARGAFTVEQLEDMRQYCLQECAATVKLMERLHDYLNEVELSVQGRWSGAGAVASAILKREGVDQHVKEFPTRGIPAKVFSRDLYLAQRCAYFGGRFENSHFGTYTGPVFNYDLHSAFPGVMPDLPSMRGGQWRHVKGMSDQKYSLLHVRWHFPETLPWYPFPFRTDSGAIYYPANGQGWYYRPEVEAALRAFNEGKLSTPRDRGRIEIIESWEFHPGDDTKPFAFVPALYQQRQAWKAERRAAEKVLKFGLNSIYGKTCQSVGATEDDPPRFHQLFWAGWITSAIRARVFDAVMQAPDQVVMLTSDGLYSTAPLDLDIGPGLGQWELKQVDGVLIVRSGVYWGLRTLDHEPSDQERTDGKHALIHGTWYTLTPHYQGYDRNTLTVPAVLAGWKQRLHSLQVKTPPRFVTMSSAFALKPHNELRDAWLSWREVERRVDLFPFGKRLFDPNELSAIEQGKHPTPDQRLLATWAAPIPRTAPATSQPYKLRWLDAETDEPELLDGIDAMIVLREILEVEL